MTTTTRGFREPSYFVLASLLDGPLHGYGIIKQAALLSDGDIRLAPGTLYGALDRLAAAGLIESSGQEVVAGRPRHYYRLTGEGRELLLVEAKRLALAARAVLDHLTVDLVAEEEQREEQVPAGATGNGATIDLDQHRQVAHTGSGVSTAHSTQPSSSFGSGAWSRTAPASS